MSSFQYIISVGVLVWFLVLNRFSKDIIIIQMIQGVARELYNTNAEMHIY